MLQRQDDLLWSINERLGGGEGISMPRLGSGWIDDIVRMIEREADNLPDMGFDD